MTTTCIYETGYAFRRCGEYLYIKFLEEAVRSVHRWCRYHLFFFPRKMFSNNVDVDVVLVLALILSPEISSGLYSLGLSLCANQIGAQDKGLIASEFFFISRIFFVVQRFDQSSHLLLIARWHACLYIFLQATALVISIFSSFIRSEVRGLRNVPTK